MKVIQFTYDNLQNDTSSILHAFHSNKAVENSLSGQCINWEEYIFEKRWKIVTTGNESFANVHLLHDLFYLANIEDFSLLCSFQLQK